jgi:hypothetical protein
MMIFIGLSEGTKGWKFLRIKSRTIFIAATATFDENYFPNGPDPKKSEFIPQVGQEPTTPSEEFGDKDFPTRLPSSELDGGENSVNDDDQRPIVPHLDDQSGVDQENQQQPKVKLPPPSEPAQGGAKRPSRSRKAPVRPGNIYGDSRTPSDLTKDLRRGIRAWKNTDDGSERNQKPVKPISLEQMIPESSSNPSQNIPDSVDPEVAEVAHVAKLAQEGGEEFISYMLARAFPLNSMDTPNTFRELQRMSPSTQKLWKDACKEELNHLRERGVIELTDLPNGFTPLDNRWVFLQKSDGRLRSRLVVKGFKQVEGIDYNEIFSPRSKNTQSPSVFDTCCVPGFTSR